MRILLINGSPKGERSNSLRLARSFLAGFSEETAREGKTAELEELHLAGMNVKPCKGFFLLESDSGNLL